MQNQAQRLACYDALARSRAQEPPAIGTIQVCRAPGIQGLHQNDTIEIPAGATVINNGEKSSLVAGSAGIVILATLKDAVLMSGQNCVKIQARVKENQNHRPVMASPTLYGAQGGSGSNIGAQWAVLATYRITVVEDFK